jgi:hypothetical protein
MDPGPVDDTGRFAPLLSATRPRRDNLGRMHLLPLLLLPSACGPDSPKDDSGTDSPSDWCDQLDACWEEVHGEAWSGDRDQETCREEIATLDLLDPFSPACEDGEPDMFLQPGQSWEGAYDDGAWTIGPGDCPGSLSFGTNVPSITLTIESDGYELALDTYFRSQGTDDYGSTACHTDFPHLACDDAVSDRTGVAFRFDIEVVDHVDPSFSTLDLLHVTTDLTDADGCSAGGEYDLTGRLSG